MRSLQQTYLSLLRKKPRAAGQSHFSQEHQPQHALTPQTWCEHDLPAAGTQDKKTLPTSSSPIPFNYITVTQHLQTPNTCCPPCKPCPGGRKSKSFKTSRESQALCQCRYREELGCTTASIQPVQLWHTCSIAVLFFEIILVITVYIECSVKSEYWSWRFLHRSAVDAKPCPSFFAWLHQTQDAGVQGLTTSKI